jgi:ADP-ribose pyrophosphatase YjhB (NUDIX family)
MDGLPACFERRIPTGDNRERLVCRGCGFIHYDNPRIIVGAVCSADQRILLCRRAIAPRRGYWTIPAGFLEVHEAAEAGAAREALEEAGARIHIDQLLGVYSLEHISQVHLIFRATLADPHIEAGEESLEVRLFAWEEIPWEELAFPSVTWALQHHHAVRSQRQFPPFANPPGERGSAPAGE